MNEGIAKKYVKALMISLDDKELLELDNNLTLISQAFKEDKFLTIIQTPDIKREKKVEFILSLVENPTEKTVNLIKLLGVNNRYNLIPSISSILTNQIAISKNEYFGKVEGNFPLTTSQISLLEESFGKKFDALIKFENKKTDYPGIKIEVVDLGVEVSFSMDRLKSQITEHILKAI